jgi:hypothetical protein
VKNVGRKIISLLAFVFLVIVGGCTVEDRGVFISLMNEDVTLEFRTITVNKEYGNPRDLLLPNHGEQQTRYNSFPELTVLDSSKKILFQEVLPILWPDSRPFRKNGETKMYFLVTRDGAYPIPSAWQKSWRNHIPEITAGFDREAARKKLVETGWLKN